jgi:adenylate cyclase
MALEIERKFLVVGFSWRSETVDSSRMNQGYLCIDPRVTVRVRVEELHAHLTVKGKTEHATRDEFEYEIPRADAVELLNRLCVARVAKVRHRVPFSGLVWEIDEFEELNDGLIVAEIELSHPDQPVDLPTWAGTEVTDDPRYYNSNLARSPYCTWR